MQDDNMGFVESTLRLDIQYKILHHQLQNRAEHLTDVMVVCVCDDVSQ